MSATSQGHHDKVTQLLATANDLIKAGKQEDGALALREAITLSPDDDRVRQAFKSMGLSGDATSSSDMIQLARAFATNIEDDKAASALVLAASNGRYSPKEAEELLELLFGVENDNTTKNDAIKRIVTNENGRKAIATLLQKNATETFQNLWNCGDAVVSAVIAITLNTVAWSTEKDRLAGSRNVFLLLLAKLLEPAQEASGMGMRAMARLLAVDAANIAPLIDASNFEVILSMLDIQQSTSTRSQAILVTSKFLEMEPDRGQKLLTDYVVTRAGKPNVDDLVAAFSVAAAIFPVLPAVASSLFMTPGFLDDLVALTKKSNSARLGRASLELLSAACVDKTCREAISNICAVWLQEVMEEKARFEAEPGNNLDAALAALVLCKIQTVPKKAGVTIDVVAIASFLRSLAKDGDIATVQTAIEALAYASIQGKVKEELSSDATFLPSIITMLKDPTDKGLQFGGLTIISNLTSYLPTNSAEQEKITQLKAYANQSKPEAADALNDDEHVTARCRKVIDAGVVSILVNATKSASPTLRKIIATISLSLTKNPKHCGLLVQQGLFDTIIRLANMRPKTDIEVTLSSAIHHTSSHALSRILIPLDPSLVFNNTTSQQRSLSSAIAPLASLLGPDETNTDTDTTNQFTTPDQTTDKLATFDALRALTNIASLSDLACQLITATCFAQIEPLLWSRISALTQAATELISNLTQSPSAASKFFFVLGGDDKDKDKVNEENKAEIAAARGRLTLLFALTTSETRGTALAAMAALSSILAYEAGAASFLALPLGNSTIESKANPTHRLINSTKEGHKAGDTDMLARALTAVCALVASGGAEAKKCMSDANGNGLLKGLVEYPTMKRLGMREMVGDAIAALK